MRDPPAGPRLRAARLVASFLGTGYAPVAPGTAGSLAALLAGAAMMQCAPWVLPAAIGMATLAGLWAVRITADGGDPGWVVIDEVAGQWTALVGLAAPTGPGLLAAFALFRLLDIAKPGPIGWIDRHRGPAAVMADDLLAGAAAAGILWAIRRYGPGII